MITSVAAGQVPSHLDTNWNGRSSQEEKYFFPTANNSFNKSSSVGFTIGNLRFLLLSCMLAFALPKIALAQPEGNKTIIILPGSKTLRQIELANGTTIITLAGNAAVQQEKTIIKGDSIVVNQTTGVAEVFGHVHINDADTVNTYADYLRYVGNERTAFLKKNVKLTDGKGTLLTDDLEYNLASGVAKYRNGGKVLNGKTVLTSKSATYYEDTKDVYFKEYVHLTDPDYDIKADSLLYNTQRQEARFIGPTVIKEKNGAKINTTSGYYNLATGKSEFYQRTAMSDSGYFVIGDQIANDDKTQIAQITGRGKIVDSANNVTILGNLLYLDKKNKSFLGTQKPILILYRGKDSTFITADTLFSGLRLRDKLNATDTLADEIDFNKSDDIYSDDVKDEIFEPAEVLEAPMFTPPTEKKVPPPAKEEEKKEFLPPGITKEEIKKPAADSSKKGLGKENTNQKKTTANTKKITPPTAAMDTVRYFIGFNNVRIFNDSLQAVCDSMYYSSADSVFRLFRDPLFWNDSTQVAGDTMYLYTANQKPTRLFVFNNSMVINKTREGFYNQIGGRTLNGYFKSGSIDYIRVKGTPAESIFYPQDDDSAYIGMNKSKGDVIDIYFVNKELNKVKFINDVDGTLFPFRFIKESDRFLKNFLWEYKRRPRTKLQMFE